MGQLLTLVLVALIAWRLVMGHWPWQAQIAAHKRKLVAARRLLGVAPAATREQVLSAHRRRISTVHPDRGGSTTQVHETNEARDLLLAHLPHDRKEEA